MLLYSKLSYFLFHANIIYEYYAQPVLIAYIKTMWKTRITKTTFFLMESIINRQNTKTIAQYYKASLKSPWKEYTDKIEIG